MRIAAVLVLTFMAVSLVVSQEEVIRIPGEVRFASAEMQQSIYYNHQLMLSNQPPAGVGLPKWAGRGCRFGVLKLGRPLQQWHFVIAPESLRAVVDANRNNDLTDDPVLVGTSLESLALVYAPVRLTVPLNGTLCSRYFSIYYSDGQAYLVSEDLRRFSGTVDGQPFQMTIVDSNADGAFDTPSQRRREGDRCLLPAGNADMPPQDAPIPRLYRLGNRYYRLKVAPDGSVCELRPSEVLIARVKTNYPQVKLALVGKEVGFWEAEATEGVLELPADEYTITEYHILTRDAQGATWELTVDTREQMKLKASGSEETLLRLPGGLAIFLGFGSRVKKDTLEVSLVLWPAGQRFQQVISIRRNGELPPPPTLRIVDRRGRTIKVEKFHYG